MVKQVQAGFSERGLQGIDAMMQDYVSSGKSAGMLSLLSRNGEIAYLSGRGYSDIASKTPVREDTIFRIYSMTKPITSVALMTLYEQGRFELDDAAKRWIPALAGMEVYDEGRIESDITVRQLLTHTAGFSYGFEPDKHPVDELYASVWRQRNLDISMQQLLEKVLEFPLLAQPGSRWHYSIATDICGHLVELMSDMTLADFLQREIFEPLDMVDTGFEVPSEKIERFATLYGYSEEDPLAQLEYNDTSPFIPAISGVPLRLHSGGAGLTSTAPDYLRFAQMMLNRGEIDGRRILKPETVALMTQNHLPQELLPLEFNGVARGPYLGYGFGLGYCVTIDSSQTAAAGSLGDFGWGGLADTYCWIDPQYSLVAILMQQFMPSLHHAGRRDFRDRVYAALVS